MSNDSTFESTLEKIKSRGFREVWIRPTKYVENRIDTLTACHEIIRESKVVLRGWDFPHISNINPPYNRLDYIESYLDWDMYKEIWRYYQNGQFIHLSGIKEDWFNEEIRIFGKHRWSDTEPGTIFGYINWLYSVSEIFEFTTRIAQTGRLGTDFKLNIELHGMNGRRLVSLDKDFRLSDNYICEIESLPYERTYSVEDFLVNSATYALEHAIWLYERFNFNNPPREVLRSTQEKFLKGKFQ